jgi:hypothetical protein
VRWATGGRARDGQPSTSFKKEEEEEALATHHLFFANQKIYRRRGARISGNSHVDFCAIQIIQVYCLKKAIAAKCKKNFAFAKNDRS